MLTLKHALLSLILYLGLPCICRAQGAWMLTTADFHTDPVLLHGIDKEGVHVSPTAGGEARVIPIDQFLEITRQTAAAPAGGKYLLHMTGGDQLGGEPVAMKGNNLLWRSPVLGEISLPMKGLSGVTQPGKRPQETREAADVVTLANGDALKGIITAFGDGKITVQTEGGNNSQIALTSVVGVQFA